MFYYRYRSGSELSIKELIYDEIYFASATECNDPYEGKMFARLDDDNARWDRLVRCALKSQPGARFEYLVKKIVDYFVARSPMYIDEILKTSTSEYIQIASDEFEQLILKNLIQQLKQYVSVYVPSEQYFISLSRNNDNTLMWSHYANNHRGFCLIFRSVDGQIYQSPTWKKTSFSFTTPKSFSPRMTFPISDSFIIKDIEYLTTPGYIDGFMCFPPAVIGEEKTPEEMGAFRKCFDAAYFQKHTVWDYEEESRIVLSSGTSWLAGERLSLTPHQRLFHFDSTQLAGIILGAKMPNEQKKRIKEIVSEKVDRWYRDPSEEKTISAFVLFEERLSESNRQAEIIPAEIYNGGKPIDRSSKDFSKQYGEWEKGVALHFSGSSCKKVVIT